MNIGDIVRVLSPFNQAFPFEYTIIDIHPNGVCVICEDRDFDPIFLEKV